MGKIIAIIVIIAAMSVGWYFWKNTGAETAGLYTTTSSGIVYYYGEECPHCKDVMKFLEENKIEEKVSFEKKEVWHNKKNAAEMNGKAKICGLDSKAIGVPFVFAEEKCYIGTPEVEGFFKSAADMANGQ